MKVWSGHVCTSRAASFSFGLTNDLEGEDGFVFKAVHLNSHLIKPRVLPLARSDEQDAVLVAVPNVDPLRIQRLSVFEPGHGRFGFPLQQTLMSACKTRGSLCVIRINALTYKEGDDQVDLLAHLLDITRSEAAGHTDLGTS